MCGIIGVVSENNEKVRGIVKQLFYFSQIRGKHATGLTIFDNNRLETFIEKIPSKEFIDKYFDKLGVNCDLKLIGHIRYSTSDLEFNQPIFNENISIVHNGVITQSSPENWFDMFGYKCNTRNDSELILHSIVNKKHPLKQFHESSISCITIDNRGILKFFRNGNRPLWVTIWQDGIFITSTKDIAVRAFNYEGINIDPIKCIPGVEYSISNSKVIEFEKITNFAENQVDLLCSKYYKKV